MTVRAQRFPSPPKWCESYDMQEVDRFLGDLANRLDRHEPVDPRWVRDVTFQTVRFTEGYDIDAVDDYLEQVVRELPLTSDNDNASMPVKGRGDTEDTPFDPTGMPVGELLRTIEICTDELNRRGLS